MKLYIELEEGDNVLTEAHGGTFLVKLHGHCFKSLDCILEDYKKGAKIRADYIGQLTHEPEDLPWKKWYPNETADN